MRLIGQYSKTIINWGRLQDAIKTRDGVIRAQAETIRAKTIELYRVRAELNRLRNHHQRIHGSD